MSTIPLGRFGTAEEIALAVAYRASPQTAYITGQTLLLDGGLVDAIQEAAIDVAIDFFKRHMK